MDTTSRYHDFDLLVARHSNLIDRTCWYNADGNRSLFDDLRQETLIALWRRRHLLRTGGNPWQERAWVFWQCLSVCWKHKRRKHIQWVDINSLHDLPDEQNTDRQLIEDLSEDLSPREHQLLNLILDSYQTREIAHIMGLKPSTVSQLRYRMIEKMRLTAEKHNKKQ